MRLERTKRSRSIYCVNLSLMAPLMEWFQKALAPQAALERQESAWTEWKQSLTLRSSKKLSSNN